LPARWCTFFHLSLEYVTNYGEQGGTSPCRGPGQCSHIRRTYLWFHHRVVTRALIQHVRSSPSPASTSLPLLYLPATQCVPVFPNLDRTPDPLLLRCSSVPWPAACVAKRTRSRTAQLLVQALVSRTSRSRFQCPHTRTRRRTLASVHGIMCMALILLRAPQPRPTPVHRMSTPTTSLKTRRGLLLCRLGA
jgi:hypothetical protein